MTDSEQIKGNFPFPIFPRHAGLPDYHIVNEAHTKGKANSASISSELGGRARPPRSHIIPNNVFSTYGEPFRKARESRYHST